MSKEVFFSTDVETDGPIPGPNSMLSIGSVALSESGEVLGSFSANLETLPEALPDPSTEQWWKGHPEAWKACREAQKDPSEVMEDFSQWVKSLSSYGKPVFVGFPAGFDFMFVYWYLIRFTGKSPFSFSALDGKSFAMALLGTRFRESVKRNYPKQWMPVKGKHTHIALEDALEQGIILCNMLKQSRSK